MIKEIQGGVCAAKGFSAAGVHCGIRKNKTKRDLALIVSETRASAAAVYTQNLVKGAPLLVTKENLADGYAQAVICNSGNANTCNANGIELAQAMCALVQQHTKAAAADVIVASTGVIGQTLDITPIADGMAALSAALSADGTHAAQAIMTTDTVEKEAAVEVVLGGKTCRIGGIAKGSGMIHPNMATLLGFVTTDAAITPALLQKALSAVIADSFNMVSIDGDTSTNDMVSILANGAAGNALIDAENADYALFVQALRSVTVKLSRMIAGDGEGATKLLECHVYGAADAATAKAAAKAVISSSLLKSAMFGADANWGREMAAMGYSGAEFNPLGVDMAFCSQAGRVEVCANGVTLPFDEAAAKKILSEREVIIDITLHDGDGIAEAFGCDLSYDYVKINGDYRS